MEARGEQWMGLLSGWRRQHVSTNHTSSGEGRTAGGMSPTQSCFEGGRGEEEEEHGVNPTVLIL